jgi:4-alpha-glucanotransferase
VLRYLARDGSDVVNDLIRLAYASVAAIAIVPLQDVLNLGSEARMNLPGRPEANWTWRFRPEALQDGDAAWLAALAQTYGRGT